MRGRVVVASLDDIDGGLQFAFAATVEADGQDWPALVAESVIRRHFINKTEGMQ